ncbi:MAG: ClbS/DfsB family four-helix bundle protein [Chloroflexi bacterium]|nr:ClbS/DfsB family four-helix bundle protein [Chloroflexota bacterium]
MDRTQLITQVRESRQRLDTALARIDETHFSDAGLYGRWSAKDLLAHIGWWEERAIDAMSALLRGAAPSNTIEFSDVDEVNERTYRENHDRPLDEVRQSEQEAYTALLELVERTPEDLLFDEGRYAWLEGRPLMTLVAWNMYDHYDEHLVELNAWLTKQES